MTFELTYFEKESYIAEECEPIYGPPKPGEIICPEPKEGSMTLCYAVDYLGDLIGENCTNVTKWRWTLKPKNITLEREVQKQRPETFYRPLFEEWNLDNLLLGNIKGKFIQTLSTIKFQSLSLSSL